MPNLALQFQADAERKAFDLEHRRKIRFNIGKYDAAVRTGLQHYHDHELARARAAALKAQVLEKLDTYLLEFERAFTARGGRVVWANDAQEALAEIGKPHRSPPDPHRGEGQEHDHGGNPRQ